MAVRAIRGATQLDVDERDHLLSSVDELIRAILEQNALATDDLISMLFTATPDLHSEFPALAARQLGIGDVPLLCTQELDDRRGHAPGHPGDGACRDRAHQGRGPPRLPARRGGAAPGPRPVSAP